MIKKQIKYYEFIKKESINIEYKKFTFNLSGIPIDIKQAEQYCINNLFEFNEYVINNIFKYFEIFLIKYICGFFNSNINGYFYIGVNDFGFVEGIPYLGLFPKEMIKEKMYEILYNYLKIDNNYVIKDLISINFIDIKFPKKPKKIIHPDYLNYLKKKEEENIIYDKYKNDMKNWKKKYDFITQKIVSLVNNIDSRLIIKEYIKKIDPTNELILLLESDYKLKNISKEEISNLKKTSNNIYYWVGNWKDEECLKLRKLKPTYNPDNSYRSIPLNLLICCDLVPYWIHNNNNLKLTLIDISIKSHKI